MHIWENKSTLARKRRETSLKSTFSKKTKGKKSGNQLYPLCSTSSIHSATPALYICSATRCSFSRATWTMLSLLICRTTIIRHWLRKHLPHLLFLFICFGFVVISPKFCINRSDTSTTITCPSIEDVSHKMQTLSDGVGPHSNVGSPLNLFGLEMKCSRTLFV
jgi:hypothetical protein